MDYGCCSYCHNDCWTVSWYLKTVRRNLWKTTIKILQVAPDASPEVIQMAYKGTGEEISSGSESWTGRSCTMEKMKDVNEAYEILSDKDKRWQYDKSRYQKPKTEQQNLIMRNQNHPRALKRIPRAERWTNKCLRRLTRPPEVKGEHPAERDAQRQVAGCLVVFVVPFYSVWFVWDLRLAMILIKKLPSSDAASVASTSKAKMLWSL